MPFLSHLLRMLSRSCFVIGVLLLCSFEGFSQNSQAILVDGAGPWRDDRWTFTAAQFTSLLHDAGYMVTTVAPTDVPAALSASNALNELVAVPSLESLPFDAMAAIAQFGSFGGALMASGGEPFRSPLYLAPNGAWLNASDYQAAGGSPAALQIPYLPTISPWNEQYITSSGARVPFVGSRGITGYLGPRTRVIGDVLAPAATIYSFSVNLPPSLPTQFFVGGRNLNIWIPQPQLADPYRAQLVAALHAAISGVHLQSAGPSQMVWLPGEAITGEAYIVNMASVSVQTTLEWSISGTTGTIPQPALSVTLEPGDVDLPQLSFPSLPSGDYTLSFHLLAGGQEVDSIDSPLRILDPTLSRQPNQKIQVANGAFYANGRRIFLHGVNYWPRYAPGIGANISWLEPGFYDPVQVEADLALLASLNFNLVNIQYVETDPNFGPQSRSLIDFLERCRSHGIYVLLALPATIGDNAFNGTLNPSLGAILDAAYLPGNDRVFAYELLWEPYIGMQTTGGYDGYLNGQSYVQGLGRAVLDPDWRSWVNDQYGSLAAAQQIWGMAPPLDNSGQLTSPTDDQIANDGPWRIMVAAYRRFLDDYLGRNLGLITRSIRRTDPDTLITYRNWSTMTAAGNSNAGYDLGTGAAHLDFLSPESYDPAPWPDRRGWGFAVAYARFRSGGKPVQWVEFGYPVGDEYGDAATLAAQSSFCGAFMQQVNDDGADADSVWWWPGGLSFINNADFGIVNPDGALRGCAQTLAQWGAAFQKTPPSAGVGAATILTTDRDADARGQYGLFLNWAGQYASARASGQAVSLVDQGTGADTSTMPLIGVGNAVYTGAGPLKYANAEVAGLRVVCPNLDITVENGAQVQVPVTGACQVTATMVNTGEAQWLPANSPQGGVALHTTAGAASDAPLTSPLPSLQRAALAPLNIQVDGAVTLTGRMRAGHSEDFGEVLRLTFAVNGTGAGGCADSVTPTTGINAPAAGATAVVTLTAGANCPWSASSPEPWVTFPSSSGSGGASVSYVISANPGPARQTTISIGGQALTVTQAGATPSFVPSPLISKSTLDFGAQTVGMASAAQQLTLTNSSASTLQLSAIAIGGSNNADFAQSNACGPSLAAQASCSIAVKFTPSQFGVRTASLFVSGNTGAAPLAVQLAGAGIGTGPAPSIQAVADAWNYTPGAAPGLWVTITGAGFAPFAQSANFAAATELPTNLAGVSVAFNGAPAALAYAGPTQINALVPASLQPGSAQLVVTLNGVASASFPLTATPTQPAIYAIPDASGANYYVTAALEGTGILVGNSAVDPRVTRAVLPGDVLDLYMIGLGTTSDPAAFVTSREFSGAFPVSAAVAASVGGEPAPVLFAGLTGPGLYLVRIAVPSDIKPGQAPIEISTGNPAAGSAQTSPRLALTIGTPGTNLLPDGALDSPLSGHASQTALSLQPGQVYRLSFKARSAAPATVHLAIAGISSEVSVTTGWRQYVVYLRAPEDASAAQLDFDVADGTAKVWLDGVALVAAAQ